MTDPRWRPRFWDLLFALWGLWVILADRPKWVIVVAWLIAMVMVALQDRLVFWQAEMIEEQAEMIEELER